MVKFGELAADSTSDGQNRHMTQKSLFVTGCLATSGGWPD